MVICSYIPLAATSETALNNFWDLISGIVTFNSQSFEQIHSLPQSGAGASIIVFAAGFASACGNSIILFVNRVKASRFMSILAIEAFFFALNYGFWSASTWFVSRTLFAASTDFGTIARTLGFGIAPLMLSFLVALPYFGEAIFLLLSLWSLLAIVVGIEVATGLDRWSAFTCCLVGWAVLQLLMRTVGNPIAIIGKKLTDEVADVKLVTDIQGVEQIVSQGPQLLKRPIATQGSEGDEL